VRPPGATTSERTTALDGGFKSGARNRLYWRFNGGGVSRLTRGTQRAHLGLAAESGHTRARWCSGTPEKRSLCESV